MEGGKTISCQVIGLADDSPSVKTRMSGPDHHPHHLKPKSRPGIRSCLYRITTQLGQRLVGLVKSWQRIEESSPRANRAGAAVPRQNSQLWELILGNYNPSQHWLTQENVEMLKSDLSFVYLLNCLLYSVLSTLRQYFCLNKINKLSKFDINSGGWMLMDFVWLFVPQHSLQGYQCTSAGFDRENRKYGNERE